MINNIPILLKIVFHVTKRNKLIYRPLKILYTDETSTTWYMFYVSYLYHNNLNGPPDILFFTSATNRNRF